MSAPAIGDTRTVTRFAWRPTRLDDGRRVCFRRYSAIQVFTAPEDIEPWGSLQPDWRTIARV